MKKMNIVRSLRRRAAFLIPVIFFLIIAAEDGAALAGKKGEISDGLPFLHSEAEKRSFQNQLMNSVPDILKRVEEKSKELMKTRYNFGRGVKIPAYSTDLSTKQASKRERINGTISFMDGWANGFPNISLMGESTVTYEKSLLKIQSHVNILRHMVLSYGYKILDDAKEFQGRIRKEVNGARYSLTISLDLSSKKMELVDFRRRCFGRPTGASPPSASGREGQRRDPGPRCDLLGKMPTSATKCYSVGDYKVDGLKNNDRLKAIMISVFSEFFHETVFPDIETVLHTILEDSFKMSSVADLLPEVDYADGGPVNSGIMAEELDICDTDAEEAGRNYDALRWKPVTEVPFIQNTGEMWAFQKQIECGLRELMEEISFSVTKNLADRALLHGKLEDDKFLMTIKDKTSTTRHAPMFLSGGWYSSTFKLNVSPVRGVNFRDGPAIFTASFQLENPIEFMYNFTSDFLRDSYEGEFKGSVKFVEYELKFTLNLETAALTMEELKLDCARDISTTVTGIRPGAEWFSSELERNMLHRFRGVTLQQVHSILGGSFRYVTSVMDTAGVVSRCLPSWTFDRDFRTDFEMRIGENDEDSFDTCDAERIRKLSERSKRFLSLVNENGTFTDLIPDASGKYFTHVSGVKNVGIRYTSTRTQSWYFQQELRLKMNEYMYRLLNTTRKIIETRDLEKTRMPDYVGEANHQRKGAMRMKNCWVDGLASFTFSGADVLEFDQKVISLWTNIPVYQDLKFEGEFIDSNVSPCDSKVRTQLPTMEISLRIDIDYLGKKAARLEYMKLECIRPSDIRPGSRVECGKETVDKFFREVMAEELFQIFRRSFEDAMEETSYEEFLPIWDYERDYITEIILSQNQNRLQTDMKICSCLEQNQPSLEEYYPDLETIPYSQFLPKVKNFGLRSSFDSNIKSLMDQAIQTMWRDILKKPLKRFSPLKFEDQGITLSETNKALVITAIDFDFQGPEPTEAVENLDFAYGRGDTVIMLYRLKFDFFKVTYRLSLEDRQTGGDELGTAIATVREPQYLLKVRFFVTESKFSVDQFYLRCTEGLTVNVTRTRPGGVTNMVRAVDRSIRSSFSSSEMLEVKEFIFDLFGSAAKQLDVTEFPFSWTSHRQLFEKVTREDNQQKETKSCEEVETIAPGDLESSRNRTVVISREPLPFIGSEAEWWSFLKQTKGRVDPFLKAVRRIARRILSANFLEYTSIPNMTKNFARETETESDTVICTLTKGLAGNLTTVKYVGNVTVDATEDMKITSYITFDGDLKLRYRLQAQEGKDFGSGRVRGTAKSVIYKMVISVDKQNKSAALESFDFECMREMEIIPHLSQNKFSWIEGLMPDAFRGDFTSLVRDEIRKLLEMAFALGVEYAGVLPFVEDWNYDKVYALNTSTKDPTQAGRVISSCEVD